MSKRRTSLTTSLLMVALVLGLPSSAGAIGYGGVGGRPANPDSSNSRTKSIFVYVLGNGELVQDAVTVFNNSGKAKTVTVYATDGQTSDTGAFTCEQKVEPQDNVGNWISLTVNQVQLAPYSEQNVSFTVRMPKKAGVGEHNGCIVLQEKQPSDESRKESGVALDFRSAIRVAVTIPGKITKELSFADYTINRDEHGDFVYKYILKNSGNVSLDTDMDITTHNIFGQKVFENGGGYTVMPHTQTMHSFTMPQPFWGGVYLSTATASYNGDPQATLGEEASNPATISIQRAFLVAPKPIALIVELLIIATVVGGFCYWLHRRRQMAELKSSCGGYTVKRQDTLISLAEQRNVSWKLIARVNGLKAPYHLTPGSVILLPELTKKTKRKY